MAKKVKQPKLRVALKPPKPVPELLVFAQNVHDQMAANAKTLPSPNPALPLLQTQIDELSAKQVIVKTRVDGAVSDRDAALLVLETSLKSERLYVEQLCNADPANASNLAHDAGMTLVKVGTFAKPPLQAKQGVSGTLHFVAKAVPGAKANQWAYSTDGGKTWVDAPPTTKAATTVQNLPPGTTVTVRHRALTKAGLQDWTDPVTAVVS